ncbi:MAG: exonuclease SbcCD subunit D C-terminal domain-containing protein [Planctomycetota bacterium]
MKAGLPEKPSGSYRLLHTADWHLGKLLNERSREVEHERFLAWLLDLVKQSKVDAILLAGDVFDSSHPTQAALASYFNFVSDLYRQSECQLLLIAGNHDSPSLLEAPRQALAALKTHVHGFLSESAENRIVLLPNEDQPRVGVAMVPFLRDRDLRVGRAGEDAKTIRKQLVAGIKQRYDETAKAFASLGHNCPLIGTGHLTVAGGRESTSERGIHIGGLGAVKAKAFSSRYDYVALGHLHRPQSCEDDDRVCYSGSPIALSFSESEDRKEVRVIDVTSNQLDISSVPIPVYRRLAQVRAKETDLESTLRSFQVDEGELTTWVEVIVEDCSLGVDVNEQVRAIAEDCDFEVLKVIRESVRVMDRLAAEEGTDEESAVSLLEKPEEVFDHLLNQHELEPAERDSLTNAFSILVDLHSQSETAG